MDIQNVGAVHTGDDLPPRSVLGPETPPKVDRRDMVVGEGSEKGNPSYEST
jgi:hypothetical protein